MSSELTFHSIKNYFMFRCIIDVTVLSLLKPQPVVSHLQMTSWWRMRQIMSLKWTAHVSVLWLSPLCHTVWILYNVEGGSRCCTAFGLGHVLEIPKPFLLRKLTLWWMLRLSLCYRVLSALKRHTRTTVLVQLQGSVREVRIDLTLWTRLGDSKSRLFCSNKVSVIKA